MSAYDLTRQESIDLLVKTAMEYGVTDRKQLAYILGTAQHESDDFRASSEYDGPNQAIRNGYSGGENYYGRGYVQVTHDHRYDVMADTLGDPRIRDNPDIVAQEARLGAETTVVGMVRGLYTGVGIDQYINGDRTDYEAARAVVNGTDRATHIADLARTWEQNLDEVIDRVTAAGLTSRVMPGSPTLDGDLRRGEVGPEVRRLQEALAGDGANITPDGNFGNGTRDAVLDYQRQNDLPETGVADAAMLRALGVEHQQGSPMPRQEGEMQAPDPANPLHPDHGLMEKIRSAVCELDTQAGKGWDTASDRICARALVAAKEMGFTDKDELRLAFNNPTDKLAGGEILHIARTGQNASPDLAANRAHFMTEEALRTPVEDSYRQAEQITKVQTQQIEQQELQQRQQSEQQLMRM